MAHEDCHEMGGKHTCDKRLDVSQLKERFPQVDYSLLEHEHDPLWAELSGERETWEALAERALRFMDWLWSRPEKCIAVACHGSFLVSLFTTVLRVPGGTELAFTTGEMRTMSVSVPIEKARTMQHTLSNRQGSVSVAKRLKILRFIEHHLQSPFCAVRFFTLSPSAS